MKGLGVTTAILSLLSTALCADNTTKPLSSRILLPSNFKPPQVFKNVNLVHIVNLEKSCPKESINVVIENTSNEPQDDYYLPFTSKQMEKIGGVEVKDRKDPEVGLFRAEAAEVDMDSDTQFYRIHLPKPLPPKAQQTLGISYYYLSVLRPLPPTVLQSENQYLVYTFSAYCPSSYVTQKQKTEAKFPTTNIPSATIIPGTNGLPESPQKAGSKYTYGSYNNIPAGALEPITVRYEFTKPLAHITKLERDIEVSHWGGNIAFEERYHLTNLAAPLAKQFNRVEWTSASHYNAPTTAIKSLTFPLKVGSTDAYYTDIIGNVSTSRWRSNRREASLEIKPRYPIFGAWNYPFRIGWDSDLSRFLRKITSPTGRRKYILRVPFFEGPKLSEGIAYDLVETRIILPEGAKNLRYTSEIAVTDVQEGKNMTFMDTLGRTTLLMKARNVVDESRDRFVVVEYEVDGWMDWRKPLVIGGSVFAVFAAAWGIGGLDVGIRGVGK